MKLVKMCSKNWVPMLLTVLPMSRFFSESSRYPTLATPTRDRPTIAKKIVPVPPVSGRIKRTNPRVGNPDFTLFNSCVRITIIGIAIRNFITIHVSSITNGGLLHGISIVMPLVIFSRQVLPSIFPITVFIRDDGNRIAIHCLCPVKMLIESKCNTLRQFRRGRLAPHSYPAIAWWQ